MANTTSPNNFTASTWKLTNSNTSTTPMTGPAQTQYRTTAFPTVASDNTRTINDMYDSYRNAQTMRLQESGDQALSDAQANRDKIAQNYQTQRDISAVDWERQRRNFLEGANMNGINTGAGAQAELSMMGMQQRTQNTLGAAQAQAETEADRGIADIKRNTQAAINQAIAENDFKRAAALLDEYNKQYSRALSRAQTLASFGDFSGYAALYGQEHANAMWTSWVAQNPKIAYMMGQITAEQYANLQRGIPINNGLNSNGRSTTGGATPGAANFNNGLYSPPTSGKKFTGGRGGSSNGAARNFAENLRNEIRSGAGTRIPEEEASNLMRLYGL